MKTNFISGVLLPTALLTLGVIVSVGCDGKTTVQGSPGEGIHVEAPGVKVDVGGGKGVQVEAPKATVDANADNGIHVETPKSSIDLGGEKSKSP